MLLNDQSDETPYQPSKTKRITQAQRNRMKEANRIQMEAKERKKQRQLDHLLDQYVFQGFLMEIDQNDYLKNMMRRNNKRKKKRNKNKRFLHFMKKRRNPPFFVVILFNILFIF